MIISVPLLKVDVIPNSKEFYFTIDSRQTLKRGNPKNADYKGIRINNRGKDCMHFDIFGTKRTVNIIGEVPCYGMFVRRGLTMIYDIVVLFCYKARRKRREHERSVGGNTSRRRVFLPTSQVLLPPSECFITEHRTAKSSRPIDISRLDFILICVCKSGKC